MNKAEQTRQRILEAALQLFRQKGFAATTMREVADAAGLATGAAYYHFPSKESIVLAFYDRARSELGPLLDEALAEPKKLEARIVAMISVKLRYFTQNRKFLGALIGSAADPSNPLSPFSADSESIRNFDLSYFEAVIAESEVTPPKDLAPHLAAMLWMYQMGILFFWLTDDSEEQARTHSLLSKSTRMLVQLLKLSSLPLMRPVRRSLLELVEIVRG
jgi:AcrR family transcriptional regulator